jgi:PAS domain S-box-containing protein
MKALRLKPLTPWPLIVLFVVISLASVVSGLIYYSSYKKHLLSNCITDLTTITDLKVRQIIQWREVHLSTGSYLSQNVFLARQFMRFISGDKSRVLKSDLLRELKSLSDNYEYKTALFLDTAHNVRLFYPNRDTIIGDYLRPRLQSVFSDGRVVLSDLHQTGKVSFVHLDLLVPLKNPDGTDSSLIGLLVLRVNPRKALYPLIQSWTGGHASYESILFHREGDEIVYLNELRYMKNTEMVLRKPVSQGNLAAARALQGIMISTNSIDYRGVPVIASMKKVPDSPWYLETKVDRKEVLGKMNEQFRLIKIIVFLFIFTTGSFMGFLWWNQRVRYYLSTYDSEIRRLSVARHNNYILKYANDIILLLDSDHSIIEANEKAVEIYGYDRKELTALNVSLLCSDAALETYLEEFRAIDTEGYLLYETTHRKKDGSFFPIEISARVSEIDGSKYYHMICRDITERKTSGDKLRESEEKFRKIFEESPFPMVMAGKDLGIIKANSSFCRMIGYPEDEFLGLTFKELTHPEDIEESQVNILRLIAGELPVFSTEKRYIRKNGSVIWGSTTVSLVRNDKGNPIIFLAMVEDITARKLAKDELEKAFSIQKATLESTADGILVIDNDGKIVQYNKKFAEMWRIPGEVLDKKEIKATLSSVIDQLKYPEKFMDSVYYRNSYPDAISTDLAEFRDGRYFEIYTQPQKIGGKTAGRVLSFRDITERKKAEAELISAKERAEESDRLKTAFLQNVSHEIRTPMNAILGFTTLLSEPRASKAERKQYIDIIFQNGTHLLSIINDIVDIASIESGHVKMNLGEINVNVAMRKISDQFSYKAKEGKILLALETPLPNDEAEIRSDGTKLVQIITNLLNNAFKFTEKGRIDFGYSLKNNFLEFYVADTGIGIMPEHQNKIFKRFYQVENSSTRKYAGTGLGLSICKAYIELMGGKIWFESKPGKGSKFLFTIPYRGRKNDPRVN